METTLDLLVKPNPLPGYISVNPEFMAALKEEKERGETKIADAFKQLVDAAYRAAKASKARKL